MQNKKSDSIYKQKRRFRNRVHFKSSIGPLLDHLGSILDRAQMIFSVSRSHVHTFFEPSWTILGQSSTLLEPPRRHFRPSSSYVGPSLNILGIWRAIFKPSWSYLGPFWGCLGAMFGHLAAVLGYLGPFWIYLGPSWGYLEPS